MTVRMILMLVVFFVLARPQELNPFDSKPYLTPTDSAGTSIYVNWNTALEESTIVACGTTADLADTVRVPGVHCFHHARIRNLSPGTGYYYRVLPAGDLKKFQTFSGTADSFQFAVIGDTRSDSVAHQSVIDRLAGYPSAFYLHLGDYTYYGYDADEWRIFFNTEDTVTQDRLILPVVGNHEDPYWPFDTLFARPDTYKYYSVKYANAHFVVLNTSQDLYNTQRDWLRTDLMAARSDPAIDWIFAAFHRPAYSSGPHGSQADVQDAWCPLFDSNAVDMVLAGHDHTYERTFPINGVTYVVSGGGGAPLHSVGANPWTAYSESTFEFCWFKVRGRQLVMYAIKPDGTIFDSVAISKPIKILETKNGPKRLIDVFPNPFRNFLRICLEQSAPLRGSGAYFQDFQIKSMELKLYNISGQLVKSFTIPYTLGSLPSAFNWDGRDARGKILPAGVYLLEALLNGSHYRKTVIKIR